MNPMIWVIDDDASIRFVFDKALDANSITHRLFETGEAALTALESETPDVIVSDIRMPGINGLDLVKKVHEIDENIPFIIMTAHSKSMQLLMPMKKVALNIYQSHLILNKQ